MKKTVHYNRSFDNKTGFMVRWGKTYDDDPDYSPVGPEILDMEISTKCSKGCTFCYKSNVTEGKNMSFDTFVKIFKKIPKNLTQIAFGIGDINGNPDLFKIMKYCRKNDYNKVVPNITVNGIDIDSTTARYLSMVVGSIAVSHYDDDSCFNAVEKLTAVGLKQVNIHQVTSEETFNECMKLLKKYKSDKRLEKLNAIVFLQLKPKGRGVRYSPLMDRDKYSKLVNYAIDNEIRVGFDSCSAFSLLNTANNTEELEMMVDPCESDCFSAYINVDGIYHHCSFCEGEDGWKGIDILKVNDFIKEVWYHPEVLRFRNQAIENKKKRINCQLFNLDLK